ncbi:MAG: caspase domain-containing protein [Pseudomonadales bacterium]
MTNTRAPAWDAEEAEDNPPNQQLGQNHLLAIGIDAYQDCTPLHNAVRDASDIADALQSEYDFRPENVCLITDETATEERIFQEFRSLVQRVKPEDSVLIFFSGHGHFDEDFKQGYWIPVDAKENNIGDYIPNSEISNTIRAIPSLHTFMIADACFSGSLFGQSRSVGSAGGGSSYHQRVGQIPSRWGLASGRNEVVADGEPGKNSPFSESLIYFLRNQTDSTFCVSELVQYVKTVTANNAEQTPVGSPLRHVGDKGGEFVFRPNSASDQLASYESSLGSPGDKKTYAQPERVHASPKSTLKAWAIKNSQTLSLVAWTTLFFGLWGSSMFFYVPLTLLGIMGVCEMYGLKGVVKTRFTFAALVVGILGIVTFYFEPLAASAVDADKWFNNHKVLVFSLGLVCLGGFLYFFLNDED